MTMNRYEDQLDFNQIRTWPLAGRHNLVTLENMADPDKDRSPDWNPPGLDDLVERLRAARAGASPIIWSLGAHVIKNGLSRYLIDLVRHGWITHLSGNGAVSIHDFELAMIGGTSEDVPTAIEDGSFGMWEETGKHMNLAIRQGWQAGLGYGEAIAAYIDRHPDLFPHRAINVAWQAARQGIPATYHIALGTDIIHQHPDVDFAAIGGASGIDFRKMCVSVSRLDGGAFLNFGSSVIGPEVFLKALSIARNLGYPTYRITTANFDLIDLGDYHQPLGYDDPLYYYRPRKNIVNRPVSRGGKGYHFTVDHKVSIPALHARLVGSGQEAAQHG
ncbi:MAG: hypothetical protein GX112_11400 [Clostridiaceae bacterium]|nr:hypothetical protein [Clostridiaceae bacterium]